MKPRLTWKRRLEPFARLYEAIDFAVEELTLAELRTLLLACDRPTDSNCGWSTYRVVQVLRPMIVTELARRDAAGR